MLVFDVVLEACTVVPADKTAYASYSVLAKAASGKHHCCYKLVRRQEWIACFMVDESQDLWLHTGFLLT